MSIDLSGVLTGAHVPFEGKVPVTLTEILQDSETYPVLEADDLDLSVAYVDEGIVDIRGKGRVVVEIPCDRCLDPVPWEFDLDFKIRAAAAGPEDESWPEQADDTEETEELEELDGSMLDVDALIRSEIVIGWPAKILCREDCRGICSVCGQNLNHGTCTCQDTGLDPRMSAIRDVFKNFKEV